MPTNEAMVGYFVALDTGEIEKAGRCEASLFHHQGTGNGRLIAIDGEPPNPERFYWTGSAFAEYPPRPGPWAKWNGNGWVDPRTPADFAKITAQKWAALRQERDRLLALCDWTQVPDVPLTVTQKLAWQSYRRALRDMPEKTADPAKPVWPTPPKS